MLVYAVFEPSEPGHRGEGGCGDRANTQRADKLASLRDAGAVGGIRLRHLGSGAESCVCGFWHGDYAVREGERSNEESS